MPYQFVGSISFLNSVDAQTREHLQQPNNSPPLMPKHNDGVADLPVNQCVDAAGLSTSFHQHLAASQQRLLLPRKERPSDPCDSSETASTSTGAVSDFSIPVGASSATHQKLRALLRSV